MQRLSFVLAFIAAASACIDSGDEVGDDGGEEDIVVDEGKADGACRSFGASYSAFWKTCRIVGRDSALRDGEIVFTIDDGFGSSSRRMAEVLAAEGVPATFFPAAHNFGTSTRLQTLAAGALATELPPAGSLSVNTSILDSAVYHVVVNGHTVANHTYSHPIGNAQTGAPSFASMRPDQRQRAEVVDAHLLTRMALEEVDRRHGLGGRAAAAQLRFFRSPGNSWDEHAARVLSVSALREYRGPISWDVPASGDEDFRCWSAGLTVEQCGERYLAAFRAMPRGQQRAVVLLHDTAQSVELARYLARRFRELGPARTKAGNCLRFVPLRCTVGCDRSTLPASQPACL
jgi:peptidoglycan/xylan/chitin deacetylase (PgdA/CDA1 family)